jgi:hypothetical protein
MNMDHDRSTANKAASGLSNTVGRMNDRTKVILVKATGEGPQKVRNLIDTALLKLYFREAFRTFRCSRSISLLPWPFGCT